MPNLCFKFRKKARTVQLVRHVYSSTSKRSKTVTLGSIAIDADPDDYFDLLSLRPDVVLTDDELVRIAQWLAAHGDAGAAARRKRAKERIEARVRECMTAEKQATTQSAAAPPDDTFELAKQALSQLAADLPAMAEQVRSAGGDPWKAFRPKYLNVTAAADQLVKVAQQAGVAKIAKRSRPVEIPEEDI